MFNEDLKYTKQIDWENILQTMENYINKLLPRYLSLYGSVILLNNFTLILSKTTYLSNIFQLDLKSTKINFNIFGITKN